MRSVLDRPCVAQRAENRTIIGRPSQFVTKVAIRRSVPATAARRPSRPRDSACSTRTVRPCEPPTRETDCELMRQLTSLDSQFLALESARQYGHVGGLAILDPSTAPRGEIELADLQA